MGRLRLNGPPPDGRGGLFGSAAYLIACAGHDGGTAATVDLSGVSLPVVVEPGGGLHTPYGYPQPHGQCRPEALRELAAAAAVCERPWRCALAPIGPGAELAAVLAEHVEPKSSRPICIHDLDEEEPLARFTGSARGMVRRAIRLRVRIECAPPTPEFGALYRANMQALAAAPEYWFDDGYLLALRDAGATQVMAYDGAGLAAAALFLIGAPEASYHLSARRVDPAPPPGVMNLILLEGLRQCRGAGASHCYLGGGRTAAPDDPLLRFKASMSTRTVERPTFEHALA
jgi:hypothetical protein